jgi:molybdenum cofactor guanylyltransferase
MDFACAILAGGKSSRMGSDKASLRVGRRTLLERVVGITRDLFSETVIVARSREVASGMDIEVLHDFLPKEGPIVGVATALLMLEASYTFVLACDMPFVSREAIRYMMSQVDGQDVIIPKTDGGYEPLHAIYKRTCLSPMMRLIEGNNLNIRGLFPYVTTKVLEGHESFLVGDFSVFTNINTVEDLSRVAPCFE